MAILQAVDLHKSYQSGSVTVPVLRGAALSVEAKEIVVILGKSGSGKSTFLNVAGGLEPPDSGHVFLNGQDIYKLSESKRIQLRNREIGFIFQEFHLINELNVLENIRLPFDIAKRPYDCAYENQVIKMLDLNERLTFYPSQLSGGERQRVAAARAIASRPSLIFADEPTGNLDSGLGKALMNFVKETNQTLGQTWLIVTHDREWTTLANRVMHMTDGLLSQEGGG